MAFFARIGRLIRGFFGLFVGGMERRNPEALLEAARQDFRTRMHEYRQALARMAGLAEQLKNQLQIKTERAQSLERRILANHSAGNMDLAASLARELQELKADLAADVQELRQTEEGYQASVRQAQMAQKEFEDKVRHLERQLSQVKVKEAQAEAASALSSVAFKVGDMGDTVERVEEVLSARYQKAAGKARVAHDLADTTQLQEKEAERKALEQQALAEFLASQGISTPAASAPPPAAKEIGPGQPEGQSEA